jgi:hypothetical protein
MLYSLVGANSRMVIQHLSVESIDILICDCEKTYWVKEIPSYISSYFFYSKQSGKMLNEYEDDDFFMEDKM